MSNETGANLASATVPTFPGLKDSAMACLTPTTADPATRAEARKAIDEAFGPLEIAGIDLRADNARELLQNMDRCQAEYAGSALREMARLLEAYEALPADGEEGGDDEADFIDPGPFSNVEPEFVEMTAEDEASIRGEAA